MRQGTQNQFCELLQSLPLLREQGENSDTFPEVRYIGKYRKNVYTFIPNYARAFLYISYPNYT